jgi:hypothetical protein
MSSKATTDVTRITAVLRASALAAALLVALAPLASAQQIITSGGNTYSTGLSAGTLPVASGPTGLGPSSFTDNGTIAGTTEPFAAPLSVIVTNFNNTGVAPGTTQYALTILQTLGGSNSEATIATTGTTQGVLGVCMSGCGSSGNASIARWGTATCSFDGGTTAGDYFGISSTVGGDCHDLGSSTYPTSGQPLGFVLSTNSSAGNYIVILDPGVEASGGGSGSPITLEPGLASVPGTYNGGTQTVTGGGGIYLQSYPTALTTSCTVNSNCVSGSTNDAGRNFEFTASGQTATLPSPSSASSVGFTFSYDGSHTYSLATASGNFIGACGSGTSSLTGIAYDVQMTPDPTGSNWLCHPSALGITAAGNNAFTGNNTHSGSESFAQVNGIAYPPSFTSGSNYNAASSDCGKTLLLPTGSSPTVTMPNISPASGECSIKMVQMTSAQWLVQVASGGTLVSVNSYSHTKAQYAVIVLTLIVPSTTAATWDLSGDGS